MGLGSVILVGHDDGGLLALRTAEKLRASGDSRKVQYCDIAAPGNHWHRVVVLCFVVILKSLGCPHWLAWLTSDASLSTLVTLPFYAIFIKW